MENEKIVKALEEIYVLGKFRREDVEHALVYIYTLQKENLDLKAEIERLTEENKSLSIKVWNYEQPARTPLYSSESMVNCNLVTCYNENADLKAKNTELQKQVDKLKKSQVVHIRIDDKLQKEYEYELKQAVKDTAKEILDKVEETWLDCHTSYVLSLTIKKWIKEHYGVEVE